MGVDDSMLKRLASIFHHAMLDPVAEDLAAQDVRHLADSLSAKDRLAVSLESCWPSLTEANRENIYLFIRRIGLAKSHHKLNRFWHKLMYVHRRFMETVLAETDGMVVLDKRRVESLAIIQDFGEEECKRVLLLLRELAVGW